jgi:hypothetical protein
MHAYWHPTDPSILVIDLDDDGRRLIMVRPPPEGITPEWIRQLSRDVVDVCAVFSPAKDDRDS